MKQMNLIRVSLYVCFTDAQWFSIRIAVLVMGQKQVQKDTE